jgi:hypothetical protein
MHLRVQDPDSLMMIRDRKPRYLVSEIDEIENNESYVLVRKSTPSIPTPPPPSTVSMPRRAKRRNKFADKMGGRMYRHNVQENNRSLPGLHHETFNQQSMHHIP